MTSSNALKCVVSNYETTDEVAPRKPFNLNKGYYCGSAGHVSQEAVKRYILEQQGKDVFEYDIFNCPKELKGQLKIGDFTGG